MSWVSIWVHLVFSTKYRYPFLSTKEIRQKLFLHVKENAEKNGIWLDSINGYSEHAHCLISLGREQSISNVARFIKGESSYWINNNKLLVKKFIWQDDYWAVGISESHVVRVRRYIFNQEKHHQTLEFNAEVDKFMKKYGWQLITAK